MCELKSGTMYIPEVKYGPPGVICGRGGPSFSRSCASWYVHGRNERVAESVGHNLMIWGVHPSLFRLNIHLFSTLQSLSFEMPVDLVPRVTAQSSPGRLSSFGFSGTIAHGGFVCAVSAMSPFM